MDRLEEIVQTCHLAEEYYGVAFEFLQGYLYLSEANVEQFDPISLKHYLLLHALEVALKGWLILEGDQHEPERLSQRPFGHDLGTLLDRVITVYGVDAFPGDYRPLIDELNRTYRGKDYEYPARTGPLVSIEPITVLEQFVAHCVQALAQKSRAKLISAT